MNREIKFRVWDKLRAVFIYPDKNYQGHFTLSLNGQFYNLQNGSGGDEYVLQQFTGLKDKNNKEIYEGDIVRFIENDPYSTSSHALAQVKYIGSCWHYEDVDLKKKSEPIFYLIDESTNDSEAEVIGNIFENPELL